MNKNILIVVVIVAVLGIGGVVLMSSMGSSKTTPTSTPTGMEDNNMGDTPPSSDTPSSASDTVAISTESFKFSPQVIKIKAGGKISYTNKDSVAHTLTSDDKTSFDSELVEKGQTVDVTAPTTPGEYPFHCAPHPSMKGTLIVE